MRANPGGSRSLNKTGVRTALKRWIADCDIRDPVTGDLARVTYHQFRHTFATRLLDNGASITLVQQLLDHESPSTTAGYAVLSDSVRRAEFERVSKVNNRGEIITGSDHALAADAEWFKEGLNRMHVSLPNGFCGLPLQQPCEVRNACLDCDDYFITTSAFLRVHEEQLSQTRREGAGVSFARVAREARVSRGWLCESTFALEIRELRSDPGLPARGSEPASDASLRARLEDALDDNRRLRSEVADLRRQLEVALGERRATLM